MITTGIPGLDSVLMGGLPRDRVYLVQGEPGSGKTTLALQMLLEGLRCGERGLYVTLSESRDELVAIAESHGWQLGELAIHELANNELQPREDDENTLYVPAEVELGERVKALLAVADKVKPQRVVIDSCSELRLLSQTQLRFRRQLLALKTELIQRGCTVVLLDNPSVEGGNELLQSLVHGVIELEQLSPEYGAERRRLRVAKLREVQFRGGYHDMSIRRSGLVVFPRLVAAEHHRPFERENVSSGLPALDAALGGGLERGTSVLFVGPSGSGKSILATRYAVSAAERGECAAIYSFDEGAGTLFARASGLGMPLESYVQKNLVGVHQIDPAELSPGELVDRIRQAVERDKLRLLVIDSLNGYLQAMPEERFLIVQLHELLSYLRQHGVLTILVVAQYGFLGRMSSPIDVSYLADTVLMTRYFEAQGRVRKAISVLKKRSGRHEDAIREFVVDADGVRVGPALADFQGVLTGVPVYEGSTRDLNGSRRD
jgi:circadian clock protein KaiC